MDKEHEIEIVIFVILLIVILLAKVIPAQQTFEGCKGDMWTGGSINLMSSGESNSSDRLNIFSALPIVRFFPADHICIGPSLGFTSVSSGFNRTMINIGGELGFIHAVDYCFPYVVVSPHKTVYGGCNGSDISVFSLPFHAGIIGRIGDNLGMQLEVGYRLGFYEDERMNTFSIGLGVCGIGRKTLVSLINNLSMLTPTF